LGNFFKGSFMKVIPAPLFYIKRWGFLLSRHVGADGYIARPLSNRELLSRIKAMMRILVVDDTPGVLFAARRVSSRAGLHLPKAPFRDLETFRTPGKG
jgi:hypothetical protein